MPWVTLQEMSESSQTGAAPVRVTAVTDRVGVAHREKPASFTAQL